MRFDTPIETAFLKDGEAAGVEILSGCELFLYRVSHAFQLFTGRQVDPAGIYAGCLQWLGRDPISDDT